MKHLLLVLSLVVLASGCAGTSVVQKSHNIAYVGVIKFKFDEFKLDAEDKAYLDSFVANTLPKFNTPSVGVIGHTDLVNSNDYNDKLGQRRAASVISYLKTKEGVVVRDDLSFGEVEPIVVPEVYYDDKHIVTHDQSNRTVTLIVHYTY